MDKTNERRQFHAWLLDQEKSSNTTASYDYALKAFFERHDSVDRQAVLDFKNELLMQGFSPKTVNLRLSGIEAYCKMKGIDVQIKHLRAQKSSSVENVISADDYQKLLNELCESEDLRGYWMIKLLAATGARVSEVIRLQKKDWERGYAEMWTKGKIRRIYIPGKFRAESADYYADLSGDDYLIQNRYGKQMTTRGVASTLKRYSKRYGIPDEVMHPHSFRHLFAINFLRATGDLSLLSDLLGHESISTTAIYTRLTKAEQLSLVDKAVVW